MAADPIHEVPAGMARLRALMARLRDPETGCPWDIEQDFDTIAPYTIEEAYEVADAIEREAWGELKDELGDLLLQVVYFTQMSAERGLFDFDDVAAAITDKMIDRHPHVFGDESRDKSAEDQVRDWEKVKAAERARKGERRTLDGVARGLPALMRALKLQKRLARVGFDWASDGPILDKLAEEIAELRAARNISHEATEEEFGDLLFVMVNLARQWGIDPEAALRRTNAKVERRFAAVEDALAAEGLTPAAATLERMDALWDEAKAREKTASAVNP